jgi:hypothetical protein
MWIEKRGLSTLDLLTASARGLDRDEREFGIAGLKDARSHQPPVGHLEHATNAPAKRCALTASRCCA